MGIDDVKKEVSSEKYNFLRTNEHLKDKIILLGLGGHLNYEYAFLG